MGEGLVKYLLHSFTKYEELVTLNIRESISSQLSHTVRYPNFKLSLKRNFTIVRFPRVDSTEVIRPPKLILVISVHIKICTYSDQKSKNHLERMLKEILEVKITINSRGKTCTITTSIGILSSWLLGLSERQTEHLLQ